MIARNRRITLFAALATVTLSGCGGGSIAIPNAASAPSAASASFARNAALGDSTQTQLFVSDSSGSNVDVYDTSGNLLYAVPVPGGQIQSLTTDATGALYVPVTESSAVAVFANPKSGKDVLLNDSGNYPVGVAVAPKTQVVAVTNILSTSGGAGSVSFYEHGKTSSCATVSDATNFARVYFAAFDANGNLFIDGENAKGSSTVGEIAGGCGAKKIQTLVLKDVSLQFPGGVAVDVKNQIVIGDQIAGSLYTFAQPKKGSLGSPLATTPLQSGGSSEFAFTKNGKDLWAASGTPGISEYAYPTGGKPIKTLAVGYGGIAVTPAETP
jgi:hypothetical protein